MRRTNPRKDKIRGFITNVLVFLTTFLLLISVLEIGLRILAHMNPKYDSCYFSSSYANRDICRLESHLSISLKKYDLNSVSKILNKISNQSFHPSSY